MSLKKLTENQLLEEILRWRRGTDAPLSIHADVKQATPKKQYANRFYLDSGFQEVYFTQREMDVAIFLFQPITYEYIAKKLNLSERTVECYVRNMKLKLGCRTKKKLMECIKRIELIKRYRDACI